MEQNPSRPGLSGWLRRNRRSILVLAVAAVLFVGLFVYSHQGQIYQNQSTVFQSLTYESARVLNVSNDTVYADRYSLDGVATGSQTLMLRLTSGRFAGQTVEITNNVSTFNSMKYAIGDKLMVYQYVQDGALSQVYVYEYNRIPIIFLLLGLFFLTTVLVGGRTGLKSLLGLALTVVTLIWIMCPLLMKGWHPAWTALLLCAFVTVVCFTILDGVNKKTVCAMLGTLGGMALAALFGVLAQRLARITSYSMYTTNSLVDEFKNIQLQDIPLHITGLLTAGIVIASLGAVMDVAMSLSSAIRELKAVNPDLTRGQLWRSAMNIGKDMVGTMTNTLILAFVGNSLILIIYLWSLELSFRQLMSSSFLAVELISSLSSSIGVILAVPLTALVGAIFFGEGSLFPARHTAQSTKPTGKKKKKSAKQ